MKKTDKVKLIVNSFLNYFLEGDWAILNNLSLAHLVKNADYSLLSESIIAENDNVYKNIDWNRVDRAKLIRIISRNSDVIETIGIDRIRNFHFTISESFHMLKKNPEIIDDLKVDFKNPTKEEAKMILKIGDKNLINKIGFDVNKFKFSDKDIYEILEYNNFDESIFNMVNLNILSSYYIAEIINYTHNKHLGKLDLNKIDAKHWCEILYVNPDLINYCNLNSFKKSDIYYTVLLAKIFPKYTFMIKDRNYKDELSILGWEKAIIISPDEFINESPKHMFNKTNWRNIISYHPELAAYKL